MPLLETEHDFYKFISFNQNNQIEEIKSVNS